MLGEQLVIDSVDLDTPHIWLKSTAPLFTIDKVGSDRPLPGLAKGKRPYRRKTTSVMITLVVYVDGEVNADGTPSSDPRATLHDHLDYLEANLLEDVADVRGTRAAVWTRPNDTVRTAAVIIEGSTLEEAGDYSALLNLEVTVSDGVWAESGS